MKVSDCEKKADDIRLKYNPNQLVPFPYRNITKEKLDLNINIGNFSDELDHISGATIYDEESNEFTIIINGNKPETRQAFTIAHELGHYFLHADILKSEKLIVDGDDYLENKRVLYRLDEAKRNQIEIEANNFAAAILMPRDLVLDAWERLEDIQECAKVFGVSAIAMTIRLERLSLIE